MVFNSLHFLLFFPVVYVIYRALPHRAQNLFLIAASYYFYAAWDWRFLGLLIGSTLVDYSMARYIARTSQPGRRRTALIVSLVYNLGVLGFFKYFNFFEASLTQAFAWLGWHLDTITLHVILPMGISFYTFMTISYVIDVYRREIEPERNLADFALFVCYFPHLVAGPVLRAHLLLPQIRNPRIITREQIVEGLWLIGWGYFQKMFVADNLSHLIEPVFDPALTPTGVEVLVGVWAFAFQGYGDFAGYSNIARGVSKLMGIELNVNFLFPYLVVSPREFWRHWHISLSTWLRDYLYFPLGGSRGSELKTERNLMLTMTLGGLWHGAGWPYILWGAYQGFTLVANRWVDLLAKRFGWSVPAGLNWQRILLGVFMFQVTCVGMLIFRAVSVPDAGRLAGILFTDFHLSSKTVESLIVPVLMIVVPFMIVHVYQARKGTELAPLGLPRPVRYALVGAVFYLILLFGDFEGAQFIYFQF
jgi:D-alanyl-lipoteichoic acid acyltransferase DltB (MBOAT superfamily)